MEIPTGTEWMVDATGCDALKLGDLDTLKKVFNAIVHELHLQPVAEPQWKKFPPPGGVTGMQMLRESHLTCHTFPEHGLATFNLYCCKPREAWPWQQKLAQLLMAKEVSVRSLLRGAAPAPKPG